MYAVNVLWIQKKKKNYIEHIYAVILHTLYVIKQLLETVSNFFNLCIDLLDYLLD